MRRFTTPEQQPVFHYWHIHPEAFEMTVEEILALHISVCQVMMPSLHGVIENHVQGGPPFILEGGYLTPALLELASYKDKVKAVFLYETEEQLVRNFAAREPQWDEQRNRARVSYLFGQWLQEV